LPIPAALDQLTGQQPPDPVALARRLHDVLEEVVDPRKRRGVRHRLVVVITVAVCAVAAGARSFVAISEWVTDLPAEVAAALGITGRCPCESTIRRIVQRLDGDRFDALISGFVQRLCAARRPGGRRRVLAVDGKTLRGARDTGEGGGDHEPARHLLAVIDHDVRVVLGQVAVDGKSNEITAFAPLLDTLTGLDLSGVVITADALHTQREHVDYLHARGAHWVLTVKGNQPRLRRQLAELPWHEVEPAHHDITTDPHPKGRHHRRRDPVPARRPGHPGRPQDPTRHPRRQDHVAHRDRLRDHRPAPAPGPPRRARRLDPRALADRERPALGTRCHLRRGPLPRPHRRRTTGDGFPPQPGDQPASTGRSHQHRRRPTTPRPRRRSTAPPSHDHMTLPRP
jgi:predicted transposase YbfD/YdcC